MRHKLPPLRAIVAFEAVARVGGVSAAARELGVTHGAVSKQLAHLEDWCGRPLFHRRDGRLLATDEARRAAAALGGLLDGIAAEGQALRTHSPTGLTIVAHATYALRWLVPRLPACRAALGVGPLRLQTMHTQDDCLGFPSDVVIRRDAAASRGWRATTVMHETLTMVAAPALAAEVAGRSPAVLARHELLESDTRPGELEAWLCAAGLEKGGLPVPTMFGHFYLALEAAIRGLGFVVAPLPIIGGDIAAGRLALPWPSLRIRGSTYAALQRDDAEKEVVADAFTNWLRAQAERAPQIG